MKPIFLWFKKPVTFFNTRGCFNDSCDSKNICLDCRKRRAILSSLLTAGFNKEYYEESNPVMKEYWYNSLGDELILVYHEPGR